MSRAWIIPIAALALFYASRADFFALLLLDLTCTALLPGEFVISGMTLDLSDVVFFFIGLLFVLGRWPPGGVRVRDVPLMPLWFLLAIWLAVSYVELPHNAKMLTDPLRIAFQLYRYCWKAIAYYVLAALLVGRDLERARKLVIAVLTIGCVMAGMTLVSYILGGHATTTVIEEKNAFAGALIAPAMACLALLLATPAGRARTYFAVGLGVLGTGLVVAGSRGAIVATAAASLGLFVSLARFAGGRRRLVRTLGLAGATVLVVLLLVPDITEFAGVRQLAELEQGTNVHNLAWRMNLRWPYFWGKVLEHPWIGTGTDRDLTLAYQANTPHNGYLSIAMRRGLPVAVLTILFGLYTSIRAWRVYLRHGPTQRRLLALGVSAAILALMTHNVAESTLTHAYVGKLFWILVAIASMSPSLKMTESVNVAAPTTVEMSGHARARARGRIPIRPIASSPGETG